MKPRPVLYALLGAALVGAFVAWWLHTYKRVDEWIDLPRTGEAVSNPLHGLRLSLAQQGRRVRAARRLDPTAMRLGRHDTVLYDGDPRAIDGRLSRQLDSWLAGGGRLVIATPPPDAAADAMTAARGRAGHLPVPLLDRHGVHSRTGRPACIDLGNGGGQLFCRGRRFDVAGPERIRWGNAADGLVHARVPAGAGELDVLADLDFLTTDSLQGRGNAELARQLFGPRGRGGTIHLVHVVDMPSLWLMLLREGWRVWLPLLLALAGWLAARRVRFGPLLPSPLPGRRSLLEHVDASGEHQWRYGHGDRLHAALRDAFHARLRRRDPQAAALDGEAQIAQLVARLRLPAAHIRDALKTPAVRDAKSLVARIATLVRMRNRL